MLLTLIPVSLVLLVLSRVWYLRRRRTARRTRDHRSVARARVSTTAPTRPSLPPGLTSMDAGRVGQTFVSVASADASAYVDVIHVLDVSVTGWTFPTRASSRSAASTGDVQSQSGRNSP